MDAVTLGPLVLPLERLAGLGSLALLLIGGFLLSRRIDPRFAGWGKAAVLLGVLGARLGYVAAHWEAYAARPWTMLYFWQGGFSWAAGAAAVALFTFVYFRESPRRLLWACLPLTAAATLWLGTRASLPEGPPPTPLPALTLPRLHGDPIKLASLRGRPLVVNLWATWCAPCRREMPLLADTARTRPDTLFVYANQGEPAALVQAYLQDQRLDIEPVLLDTAGALGRYFEAIGLPTTLFFDGAGRLRAVELGELSAAELADGLDAIDDLPAAD